MHACMHICTYIHTQTQRATQDTHTETHLPTYEHIRTQTHTHTNAQSTDLKALVNTYLSSTFFTNLVSEDGSDVRGLKRHPVVNGINL